MAVKPACNQSWSSFLDSIIRRFTTVAHEIVIGVIDDVCGISAIVSFLKDSHSEGE
nr:hypothetical protein [Candidatus Njordarchaeota archaeon]